MKQSVCIRCARLIVPARFYLKRSIHMTGVLMQGANKPTDVSDTTPKESPPKKSVQNQPSHSFSAADIKPYTPEQKARLVKKYTPAQIAAIEAGEAAISPEDLYEQGVFRRDPFALSYHTDDLSKIIPVIDKPIIAPEENYDPELRFKTPTELASDLSDWMQTTTDNTTQADYRRFIDNMRLKVGKEEAERNPPKYLAPEIPKGIPALQAAVTKSSDTDIDPNTRRLMKQSGFTAREIRSFRVRVLVSHRVVNQTRMGKIASRYYLAVAGNGRGLLGIGEAKSTEAREAQVQAKLNAIRSMQPVPRYEERTIFGDIKVRLGAVELELMTRPPGFGVRCQYLIYEMCKCAGIHDLAARVTRSRNHMNTIKATFQGLVNQRIPDQVARGLGKKLVDVRKVYYGGNV